MKNKSLLIIMMNLFSKKLWIRLSLSIVFTLAVSAIAAVCAWLSFQTWLVTPLNIPVDDYHYELDQGKTLSHLAQDLASQKILNHPRWLGWYARYQHKEKIHAGEYLITVGTTPAVLLEKLYKGDVVLHQVTLLEGWNFRQIITALNEQPDIKHLLAQKTLDEQLALLSLPITYPEGWFYPDTYNFSKGTTDVELLAQAYKKMRQTLDELWGNRAENLPYTNDYQALIMASIIEKETGSVSEREKIAGVFVRRLQQGIKLQTDPTVIYGMGESYNGKIAHENLITPTTYNTYVINGLPPTPIATPSKASLQAALHPDDSKAIYFVARGDGTSEFSETLADHQRAVAKYQLQRRSDYRSAPK